MAVEGCGDTGVSCGERRGGLCGPCDRLGQVECLSAAFGVPILVRGGPAELLAMVTVWERRVVIVLHRDVVGTPLQATCFGWASRHVADGLQGAAVCRLADLDFGLYIRRLVAGEIPR